MVSKLKTLIINESWVVEEHKLILKQISKGIGSTEQVSSLAVGAKLDPRFKTYILKNL